MSENLERDLERNHKGGHKSQEHLDRQEQERAMRLMEALSGVDERLLERCEDRVIKHQKFLWRSTRAVAAVLCLAVVGAVSWGGYRLSNMKMGSADSSGGAAGAPEAGMENAAAPWDGVSGDTAEMDTPGEAAPDGGDEEAGQREEQKVTADRDGSKPQTEMAGNGTGGFGAQQETEQKEQEEGAAEENGADGAGDSSVTEYESCLPLKSEKRTETQARTEAVLGAYVPELLPKGYAFENAYRVPEDSEANLTICWSRGMDSITLQLTKPANQPQTVDESRAELYDVHLYEIPYGESVPEEYRQTFNNPVFAAEDFDLEIVKSRMKSYDDQGDTDTPRGNFGVLFSDGVLVRFSGRGSAEEIWEMFCSMGGEE